METTHETIVEHRDYGWTIGLVILMVILGLIAYAFFSGIIPSARETSSSKDTTIVIPSVPTTPDRGMPDQSNP
jgi:hypothetical protein